MENNVMPDIQLGKSQNRSSKLDLSRDVNTTAEWGFLQPYGIYECIPGSKTSIQVESLVRLAPMVVPTFGRVTHRIYHQFVPFEELLPNFANLLSGIKYGGGVGSAYIPNSVPKCTIQQLSYALLHYCDYSGFNIVGNTTWYYTADETYNIGYLPTSWAAIDKTRWMNTFGSTASDSVTPENADFIIQSNDNMVCCFKLNDLGKRLYKILVGCGFQVDFQNTRTISFLPFLAWYKAYFDIFGVLRSSSWDSTSACSLLSAIVDYGLSDIFHSNYNLIQLTEYFLDSLTECWYTQDPDFVSAHLSTPALSSSLGFDIVNSLGRLDQNNVQISSDSQPFGRNYVYGTAGSVIDQNSLNLLKTLYTWTNKNTQIGQDIAKYLNAHGLGDYVSEVKSNYIGSHVDTINISDIVSSSDTYNPVTQTGSSLGEYGGKGLGYSKSDDLTFEANCFGYWVIMGAIVPSAGFCQAVDPILSHVERFDFYNPEFDGLGFEITPEDNVFGTYPVSRGSRSQNSFGFIPRLSSYKHKPNVVNGDFSRRGSKETFLPYSLDKFITPPDFKVTAVNVPDVGAYQVVFKDSSIPMASESWRYPTRYRYLGNYDRIFKEFDEFDRDPDKVHDDNFLIHNIISCTQYAPVKSLSESFETFDQGDNGTMSVEKA